MAQKIVRIPKYNIGLSFNIGHAFSNFDKKQDRWRATSYATGGGTLSLVSRINQRWIVDAGIGITAYILTNKGPVDNYIMDFASPHLVAGVSYNLQKKAREEYFVKLAGGCQVGYRGELVDEFNTYTVTIQSKHKWYYFIQPEIGTRRYFKRKKGIRDRPSYELGVFFRYNVQSLGVATIEEEDFEVKLEPSGNSIGVFFRFLFPASRKRIKLKEAREKAPPPIIYNPRFLSSRT